MNWLNDFNEFLEGSILALAKAAWGLLKDAFSVGGLTPEWWATVVGGQVTTVVGGQSSTIDHPGMVNVVVMAMIPVLLIMVVIQVVLSAIRGSTAGMVRAVAVAVFSVPMTYVAVGLIWLAIGATHQLTMWILTVGNSATDGEDEAVAGVLALFGLSYNAQDDSVVMDENYAQWEMALDDGSPGGILVGVLIALVIFLACAVLMAMMIFRLVVLLVLTTFAAPAIFSLALEPAKAIAARWASMVVALLMAAPVAAVIVRMGMVATAMSTDWVQTVAGVVLVFLAAAMPLTMLSMVSFMTGGAGDAVERNAVYAGQGALRSVRHSARSASARAGRMGAGRTVDGWSSEAGRTLTMAVMEKVHEQVDSEYDGARFPQERTAGLVLGLTLEQIIVIGVGVICGLVGIIGQGRMLVLGLLGFVLLGVFGAVRVHGRSGPAWAWTVLRYLVRSATGQATYKQELTAQEVILVDGEPVRPVQEATTVAERDAKGKIRPGKPVRFNLPGMSNEMLVYVLPNGAGMAWEPRRREAVVCAKVMTTRGFDLESHDAKEERSLSWGATLAAAATVGGVCRIQASDQTTLISGADVRAFYKGKQEQAGITGADIDPFLDTAFRELMKEAQDMPVHEQWLTLVVSADQIGSQLKQLGGGIPAMMEHVLKVMATMEGLLPRSGTRVTSWHSPRSLAGLCRSAFDPDAAQMVTETDSEGMAVGASPAQAGPVGVETYPGHLFTDGYLHRTFKVAELPQRLARLGFLDELVFAGDFRHTVSVYMAPRDRGAAMRDTKQRRASWETDTKLMAKLDRPPSPEHMQELEDIEREQDELMARHASLKVLVLVTVSGRTESELASATSQMVTAAATAECQLRTLWTEQDGAFIGAALPFGQVKM